MGNGLLIVYQIFKIKDAGVKIQNVTDFQEYWYLEYFGVADRNYFHILSEFIRNSHIKEEKHQIMNQSKLKKLEIRRNKK